LLLLLLLSLPLAGSVAVRAVVLGSGCLGGRRVHGRRVMRGWRGGGWWVVLVVTRPSRRVVVGVVLVAML